MYMNAWTEFDVMPMKIPTGMGVASITVVGQYALGICH
jgi:hypothetical protein